MSQNDIDIMILEINQLILEVCLRNGWDPRFFVWK